MMNLPNQLSILRICLTPVFIYLLLLPSYTAKLISAFIFGIAALTDYYDGFIARKFGYVTKWGQFLDPFADKVFVLSAFFIFAYMDYYPVYLVWIILFRDLFITVLRLVTAKQKQMIKTLFVAKIKTAGQFVVLILVYLFHLITWSQTVDQYMPITRWIYNNQIILYFAYCITIITIISGFIYIVNLFLSRKMESRQKST